MAAIRHLIAEHGTERVFVEGLSPDDMQDYGTVLGALKRMNQLYRAGAAGRLYLSGELKEVAPLESNGFEKRYNLVKEGENDLEFVTTENTTGPSRDGFHWHTPLETYGRSFTASGGPLQADAQGRSGPRQASAAGTATGESI